MDKQLPHISIEKYAAYLDGNLPDEEMQQMKAFINNDSEMQAVLEEDSSIGADFDLDMLDNEPIPFDLELPSIELPTLDLYSPIEQHGFIDEIFSPFSDRFGEEMGSIMDEIDQDVFSTGNDFMESSFEIEDPTENTEISEQIPFDFETDFIELPPFEDDLTFDHDDLFDGNY